MTDIICAAISAVAAISCTIFSLRTTRSQKRADHRAELRASESRLMLDMINANSKLTIGTAVAIKNGKANGEIEKGLQAVKDCEDKYEKFLQEIAIQHLTK